MTKIRLIVGDMPFDRDGRQATGREVWAKAAAGNWCWLPEYEGDDTEGLSITEPFEEFLARMLDYETGLENEQ